MKSIKRIHDESTKILSKFMNKFRKDGVPRKTTIIVDGVVKRVEVGKGENGHCYAKMYTVNKK